MVKVSAVKKDRAIAVDGESIVADYMFPDNLLTISWKGLDGHATWSDGPNTGLSLELVQPYIDAWQAAKDAQPEPVVYVAPVVAPIPIRVVKAPVVVPEPVVIPVMVAPTIVTPTPEVTTPVASSPEPITRELFSIASKKYLEETDWYVIRAVEVGANIPSDISAARTAARVAIIK
jgi:hypothetical protein